MLQRYEAVAIDGNITSASKKTKTLRTRPSYVTGTK